MSETVPAKSETLPAESGSPSKGVPLGLAVICPHCERRTHIRTSRAVSETYREAWAICTGCGFKGKVHVAWDAQVSPSLLPNPKVHLPVLEYQEAVNDFLEAELSSRPQLDMFANTS